MARPVDLVRLPEHIETGALIGPTFSTSLNTFVSGVEEPNSNWEEELTRIDAGYGIMAARDEFDPENSYQMVLSFFRARKGRHRAFLFRNAIDFEAEQEPMAEVRGAVRTWQLGMKYDEYFRRITRPDIETLDVYNGGIILDANQYTVLPLGRLQFAEGLVLVNPTASFEFDIPVRFDQDEMMASIVHIGAGGIPDVKLIQIRE